MRGPITAYLLLGSNLGSRAALLHGAQARLAASAGDVLAASALYETAAWGREDQPAYLNQVLALSTTLAPLALLAQCQAAEQAAGRERHERWGSRTLDVDILLYGEAIIDLPTLSVPHPLLPARRFALVPLAEIASLLVHPQRQQTIAALIHQCADALAVKPWTA